MDEWTRDGRLDEIDRQFRQLGEPCKRMNMVSLFLHVVGFGTTITVVS